MGSSLIFLRGARFKCLNSGGCCSRYDVPKGPTEEWRVIEASPERGAVIRAVPGTRPGSGDVTVLSLGHDGHCVFHDREKRQCGIHAAHGVSEKPDACRLFPYGSVETPDGLVIYTMMECDSYHLTWRDGTPVHADAAEASDIIARAGPTKRVGGRITVAGDSTIKWYDYRRVEEIILRSLDSEESTLPEVLGALRDLVCALETTTAAADPVGAALKGAADAPERSPDDPGGLEAVTRACSELLGKLREVSMRATPSNVEKLAALDLALAVLMARASGRLPDPPVEPRVIALLEQPPAYAPEEEPLRSFHREIFRQWVWSKMLAVNGISAGACDLTLRWTLLGPIAQAAAAARGSRRVEPIDLNEAMVQVSLIARLGSFVIEPLSAMLGPVWRATDVLLFLGE